MEIQGSAPVIRKERFHCAVQANDSRTVMAFYSAHIYDADVYRGIWQNRQHTYGWHPDDLILFEWHHHMELLFIVPRKYVEYFRKQCRHIWKSIFPAVNISFVNGGQQPDKIWCADALAHGGLYLFYAEGRTASSGFRFIDDPCIGINDGRHGIGIGHHHFVAHHQVP